MQHITAESCCLLKFLKNNLSKGVTDTEYVGDMSYAVSV